MLALPAENTRSTRGSPETILNWVPQAGRTSAMPSSMRMTRNAAVLLMALQRCGEHGVSPGFSLTLSIQRQRLIGDDCCCAAPLHCRIAVLLHCRSTCRVRHPSGAHAWRAAQRVPKAAGDDAPHNADGGQPAGAADAREHHVCGDLATRVACEGGEERQAVWHSDGGRCRKERETEYALGVD